MSIYSRVARVTVRYRPMAYDLGDKLTAPKTILSWLGVATEVIILILIIYLIWADLRSGIVISPITLTLVIFLLSLLLGQFYTNKVISGVTNILGIILLIIFVGSLIYIVFTGGNLRQVGCELV